MPDRRDYNSRRPPSRKRWDEDWPNGEADSNSDSNDGTSRQSPHINNAREMDPAPTTRRARQGDESFRRSRSAPEPSLGAAWAGQKAAEDEDERKTKSQQNKKRLYKMLGNQALCLAIIFGMISAFNWMASDYSGDYIGQNEQLRTVRLSITRRATTVDAELSYGEQGALQLDQSKDQPPPQADKPINLDFVTPEQFRRPNTPPWHANFTGRLEGSTGVGTITDRTGAYEVRLDKNVLTSLFTQLQSHIPRLPALSLRLFDESQAKPVFHSPDKIVPVNGSTKDNSIGPVVLPKDK